MTADNLLYYGDNLDVLRRHVKDETVDLVYLDPPFNSNASYNVLFSEQNGSQAAAQIQAFGDTWRWDQAAAEAYRETVEAGGRVSQAMQAFRTFLGDSNMLAYLAMMAPRLVELRRVLKPTGSIYLHCDPTASHYLKMLMDAVFNPANYQNEIVWKRTSAHNTTSRRYGWVTDVILFYSKAGAYFFSAPRASHDQKYTNNFYRFRDPDGKCYRLHLVERNQALGIRPNLIYEYRGYTPKWGWMMELPKLEEMDRQGKLVWNSKGRPSRKIYLDEVEAPRIGNLWDDIPPIQASAKERLGYPTQKPEALLERIIAASSNEGALVLDPFCGCGTTIAAAERLKRRWIGIDITHLAVTLMKSRLKDTFGDQVAYQVIGEPVSVPDARTLATQEPYQFQCWALGLVGARPGEPVKKGADKGIDGRLYFHDEAEGGKTKQVILSVKAGQNIGVSMVRDLGHVVSRENAEIGVLITMQEPTQPMKAEAAGAVFYHSPGWGGNHPRLQILTVADLLAGKGIDMPPLGQVSATFKKAPKARGDKAQTMPMSLDTG